MNRFTAKMVCVFVKLYTENDKPAMNIIIVLATMVPPAFVVLTALASVTTKAIMELVINREDESGKSFIEIPICLHIVENDLRYSI
ncbi:hypothetical protein CHS0354_030707 [Potamilus streckersoni]|uniref:Uncharacterized protein n=1 Tax=Potamilus streckersoni TaxID=2493646 RepID=A0AAE0SN23_9BIVA|nr:hypothetical protein CHS0354_030707 [Potamilus streckersoni]